jgi:flagellar hook-basal body complex protein FliE
MQLDPIAPLPSLPRLSPTASQEQTESQPSGSGFGAVLNGLLDNNRQANEAANAAVRDLATGDAQDLHTVSIAVAQADVSFRLILELRNRLSDALQEVTRMQI